MNEIKEYGLCSKDGKVLQTLKYSNKKTVDNYLKSGTKIKFNEPPHFKDVEGEIVGLSFTPTPIIGAHYIIKLCDSVEKIYNKKSYPYDYFCAYRCMFDLIDGE